MYLKLVCLILHRFGMSPAGAHYIAESYQIAEHEKVVGLVVYLLIEHQFAGYSNNAGKFH